MKTEEVLADAGTKMIQINKFIKYITSFCLATVILLSSVAVYAAPVKERNWEDLTNSGDELRDGAVSSAGASILVDSKNRQNPLWRR